MTNAAMQSNPVPPAARRTSPARGQLAQLLACLAYAGRRDLLENGLASEPGAAQEQPFYLAVALSRGSQYENALTILRPFLRAHPEHGPARILAYRLLDQLATAMARAGRWNGLIEVMTEALSIDAPDCDPAADFARFAGARPVANVLSGQRAAAAKIWQEALIKDPQDSRVLHHLALLHYWWARGAEASADSASLAGQWESASAYWCLLEHYDPFWEQWRQRREKQWGFDLPGKAVASLRKKISEDYLTHYLQDRAAVARQQGNQALARQFDLSLTSVLLERRAAAQWKRALEILEANRRGVSGLLALPGGPAFFRTFQMTRQCSGQIKVLEGLSDGRACAAALGMLFSDDRLGEAWVLIEDRNRWEEGLALLDRATAQTRATVSWQCLRILALCAKVRQLGAENRHGAALGPLEEAYRLCTADFMARAAKSGFLLSQAASPFLKPLREEMKEIAQASVLHEARQLFASGKLDAETLLLEKWAALEPGGHIAERLASNLCQDGYEQLKTEHWSAAQSLFARSLKAKPDFERAKQGMSTTFNNEACTEKNHDHAISLFKKAIEWNPMNYQAKQNLAREWCGKAVDRINGANPSYLRGPVNEAISWLEDAYNLVSGELADDALAKIRNMGKANPEAVKGLSQELHDEALKELVSILGTLYGMRNRIRG